MVEDFAQFEVDNLTEMSQEKAEELLEMFAEGDGVEALNTSLALHLSELAKELGRGFSGNKIVRSRCEGCIRC